MTFNTVSIVEAADTPPFFHNNIIDDLEGTVTFYNSAEFIAASGRSIPFDSTQVTQVAQFMRVINAIDNCENFASRSAAKAISALNQATNNDAVINRLLTIAIADTEDAEEVLTAGGLHSQVRKDLKKAKKRFQQAQNVNPPDHVRISQIN